METKLIGNKLTITIALEDEKKARPSSTGKSKILFTTGGFARVEGVRVNLTVINGG